MPLTNKRLWRSCKPRHQAKHLLEVLSEQQRLHAQRGGLDRHRGCVGCCERVSGVERASTAFLRVVPCSRGSLPSVPYRDVKRAFASTP